MRKRILLLFAALALLLPFGVNAQSKTLDSHKVMNLKEVLDEEGIEISDSKYKETDDQAVIYMFRGNGCAYCRAFLSFLNSQLSENGKMFKLRGLEVWYDKKNSKLLNEIADFTGEEAGGVPYIIIGEKVFPGYSSEWDEDIINAIKEEYNKKAKDRYDVFEEYDKANGSESSSIDTKKVIGWTIGSVAVAMIVIVVIQLVINANNNKKFDAIFDALKIERKLSNKEVEELEEKEVKTTKKTKKK